MKLWFVALSVIPFATSATAKCVFDKVSAQPVLKLLEIKADSLYQLNFPIRGPDGVHSGESWQLVWDPESGLLKIGPKNEGSAAPSPRFAEPRLQVWMPEFLQQPDAKAKWKTLLHDLEGATISSEPLPADSEKIKTLGILRYPTMKKEASLELIAYQFKKIRNRNLPAEGADELGRWLSIRCGQLVSK